MPKGWKITNTHPDLFRVSHYYLCSPWEADILAGWIPSRQKGWRPGLAFSGGVDSAACMALMPPETLLFYHQREGFESNLDHSNAFRFIDKLRDDGKQVVVTESDHEIIRSDFGKSPGFSTDIAGAVHVILLADYFELGGLLWECRSRILTCSMVIKDVILIPRRTGKQTPQFCREQGWIFFFLRSERLK